MRTLILSLSFLLAALTVQAAPIDGIRIESENSPILVYIDGQQMCLPTLSCFIANLRNGSYRIEVFETRPARPGERVWKGECLYDQRLSYNGRGVREIFVESRHRPNHRPGTGNGRPNLDNDYRPMSRVMSRESFELFLNSYKKESFSSGRIKMLEAALTNSDFTSEQCKRLVDFLNFDSERKNVMKLVYPRIVDPENFFTVIELLTFSSEKNSMYDFIKKYNGR